MKYCMKCGVSVDENTNRVCPLCNTIILNDDELANLNIESIKIPIKKKPDKKIAPPQKEKINKLGLVSFIMFLSSFSSILILLVVDFLIGFNISWSIIPIISIILFFLMVGIPFTRLKKRLYWYITFDTIVLCLYFLLLNYIISKEITWSYYVSLSLILCWVYLSSIFVNKIKSFVFKILMNFVATTIFVLLVSLGLHNSSVFSKLVLPLNGLLFILTVISYMFIKTYIYNWFVIVSSLSINVSLLCLGIDLLIQRYLYNKFYLKWSYIVLIVLIPFTLFMLYLDNRYKVHKYLMKKFHI